MAIFEELPEQLIAPVPGHDDIVAFQFPFGLEGKALDDGEVESTVTELDNGDIKIAGWAALFDGIDRQGENFAEGAFQRGVKAFVDGHSSLCFHHEKKKVLGKVDKLDEVPGKGLWMEATVDYQPESSPLRWIYNAVKKGTMRGLSVGGFFKKKWTEAGRKIIDMDFTDVSITGVPVHPGTSFAVVAGKALEDLEIPAKPDVDEVREEDEELIRHSVSLLKQVFDRIDRRRSPQAEATT